MPRPGTGSGSRSREPDGWPWSTFLIATSADGDLAVLVGVVGGACAAAAGWALGSPV
ncbi:hypothetical protein [Pseudonocardia sp. NPDC049154]|uniref:hypothetical protein n=1 Tax=Pseudonocardia sp. NPDC049154 TaxID=3155501 RepID=UPI0033CAB1FC